MQGIGVGVSRVVHQQHHLPSGGDAVANAIVHGDQGAARAGRSLASQQHQVLGREIAQLPQGVVQFDRVGLGKTQPRLVRGAGVVAHQHRVAINGGPHGRGRPQRGQGDRDGQQPAARQLRGHGRGIFSSWTCSTWQDRGQAIALADRPSADCSGGSATASRQYSA